MLAGALSLRELSSESAWGESIMPRANRTKGYSRNERARLQLREVVVKNQGASGRTRQINSSAYIRARTTWLAPDKAGGKRTAPPTFPFFVPFRTQKCTSNTLRAPLLDQMRLSFSHASRCIDLMPYPYWSTATSSSGLTEPEECPFTMSNSS